MPSGGHLRVRVIDVLHGAETDIHGLNGPFHLLEQDVVVCLVNAGDLNAMNADEREADALDENVMAISTNLSWAFPPRVTDLCLAEGRHPLGWV